MAILNRDVVAQTRMFLDEVSERSWLDTEVQREVNFAYQNFVTAVHNVNSDYYLTKVIFDLVNAQQEYGNGDGVPADLSKVRRIEMNYDTATSNTAFTKALPVNFGEIRGSVSDTGMGAVSNPYYYVFGNEADLVIGFLPIPQKNSTGGVRLWYVPKILNLVLPTDPVKLPYPERYAQGVGLMAAGILLRKGQQEEGAAGRYLADAQALKDAMIEELRDRVADEARVITDSIGADLDFGEPF